MATLIFWICLALLGWTYIVYPLGMVARARMAWNRPRGGPTPHGLTGRAQLVASTALLSRPSSSSRALPSVSAVLAVGDEARWLTGRIRNLLTQDYPPDKLQVVVVCYGSADRSEVVARSLAQDDPRIEVLTSRAEEGRGGALDAGVAVATGDILVFAAVRQRFDPDAIARLVEALGEADVGVVAGRQVVGGFALPEMEIRNRVMELETRLRLAESETGSIVGATDGIYALRRSSYRPIPPGALLDDAYLPVRVALSGERVVLEPRAVARAVPSATGGREYRSRLHAAAGTLQLLSLTPELARPRNPLFVRFLSHRLLRVLSPVFFVGLVATGLWTGEGLYLWTAAAILAVYVAGLVGLVVRRPLLAVPAAFVLVHAATFHALVRPGLWARAGASESGPEWAGEGGGGPLRAGAGGDPLPGGPGRS
jgi:cellulose synthase/poly-beta-1,6-N-acetylglucosamine synthase-like glycosyltransferase